MYPPQIPETPQWFLSKNRTEEAKKSLCWFRGWVPAEAIAQEFRDLQRHSIRSKSCNTCIKQDMKCSHPLPTFREKLSELKRKSTLKPFAILIPLFFLQQFTGTLAMRPYIVQIFKAYDSPVTPSFAAVLLNVCDSLGQLTFLCSIRFTGKRHLFLTMASGVFITTFIISCYGFIILPSGCDSFNQQNHSFNLENSNLAWIPMACLFMWSYFSFAGKIWTKICFLIGHIRSSPHKKFLNEELLFDLFICRFYIYGNLNELNTNQNCVISFCLFVMQPWILLSELFGFK